MKRSQESSSPNFLWRLKQPNVVSPRSTAYLWDDSSSEPRNPRSTKYSQVTIWEERRINSECCSYHRPMGIESHTWFRLFWRSVSCLGKPRSMNKRFFITNNVDFWWKDDNGKGMKGGPEGRHIRIKIRKVHFVALLDIRHIQKYEYIPVNVRKSNLECGNYENLIWDNHLTKWLTVFTNDKVARMNSKSSSSTSIIIEQFGTSSLNFDNSWVLDYSSSLRRKEENFDNLCCDSSQFTVEYHEHGWPDSNKLEPKMNLQAYIGKTVAFTMRVKSGLVEQQLRRQQQSCVNTPEDKVQLQKRWAPSKGQNSDDDSCIIYVKKKFETLIFKYIYFDTMIDVTVKKRQQK